MKELFDSTVAADIPADAQMVAGYTDIWTAADWARFPNAEKVRIARWAYINDGDFLDVERTLATPQQAPGWIRMRQAAGLIRPGIYCNRSTRPFVESVCYGLNYVLWISTLDGYKMMQKGAVATQWEGQAQSNKHYDRSLVLDSWSPQGSKIILLGDNVTQSEKAAWTFIATLLGKGHPPTQDDYNAYDPQYHDNGDNVQDIVSAICTHPEALAYQARLAKTLAFVDPEDGNAPSTTDHKHIAGGIQS